MSIDLTGLSARELGALIRTAKKQQTIVAKRRPITKVRAQLSKLAKTEGYTIEELFGGEPAPRARKVAKATKAPSKTAGRKLGKVAPKYRNPANPKETWTGRGKQPRWMAELTAKGSKKPEDFLIKKA
ncbi:MULTISPECIES: H-NS histone family protein [Stenotrophomonas]|jgi:DNA-binding protein H-NS|uniref:H-NS histone family protein n=1 Tax=Stenotrophomonas lactitubi TaxID=2045214 RepID=A0AAX2GP83_9GAMM|nr:MULTISPECIES: H-NS histone family protein [Stenotrophomonas]PTT40068.1 H-NS histone family protein [Stenotrophomonas sp. HMWF022]QII27710.1 H-NS histone family protein [Stenotrophomonas maltophilia]MBD3682852.1 H-NS histone family protein [Stenotrophomonas sp. Br8]MBM9915574.1 H-NS histone family protein [Stenotrophomonas lactitubi]MBM9922690.1 H-NS histone family protein [Stenotrophomonas lactitubi]|eukprot:TRINITY_DN21518_c0_g7_i1.p2 TRINITY_DN21518_c0_g7~~TRINITY_DN21518_c0_g7_i1.p2  ORF type:complete len:128 (+),score=69.73 TRINITY_DN21518_c0_g7_i1:49-432(+)